MRDVFHVAEGHILYGFSVFLLIMYSFMADQVAFNIYAFFAEVMVFLGPVVFMAWYMKIDMRKAFSLNQMTGKQWRNSVFFFICMIPLSFFLNIVSFYIFSNLGFESNNAIPAALSIGDVIMQVLVIGLVTGISEELFFRGMLLKAYEKRTHNIYLSICLSAFLFALMHFDIQNFLNPLFLGIVFGFVNSRTGSIYSSIVGHLIINSAVILIVSGAGQPTGVPEIPTSQEMIQSLLTFGLLACVTCVFAWFFYKGLKDDKPALDAVEGVSTFPLIGRTFVKSEKSFLIPMGVLLFYCLVMVLIARG